MKKIYELSKSFLLFRAFSILQDFGYKYTVELESEEAQKAKTTKDPPMKPILIVDDEAPIRALIRLTLERAGYTCDEAATGTEAADKIEANTYDLALLDIMLPGPDGYELLDYLRSVQTPVIFLTAKTAVADRVRGLHLGADDYITKPFEPTELVARVEAVLRRCGKAQGTLAAFDGVLDPAARRVTRNGTPLHLTPREFDLLEVLLRNRGILLSKEHKKSEPFSYREKVRIFIIWCTKDCCTGYVQQSFLLFYRIHLAKAAQCLIIEAVPRCARVRLGCIG